MEDGHTAHYSPLPHLSWTFYDSVVPDLPKVTHPLEYARIAYKVLYREYEEVRRSLNVLLESRAHAADQLQQLDVIIQMRKSALEHRANALEHRANALEHWANALEQRYSVDRMDEAPDTKQEVIDLTEDMDDSL